MLGPKTFFTWCRWSQSLRSDHTQELETCEKQDGHHKNVVGTPSCAAQREWRS